MILKKFKINLLCLKALHYNNTMEYIKTANKAIENVGGVSEMAALICEHTNDDEYLKMYQRIYRWRDSGVPLKYIRLAAKLGKVAITKLIP